MCPVPIEAFNGRETMIARRAAPQRRVSRWSRCFPRFQCALMRAFRLDNERDVSLPNTDVDRRPRRLYSRLSASLVPAPLSSLSPRPPCVLVHVIPLVPTGTMFVGILCFTVLGIFLTELYRWVRIINSMDFVLNYAIFKGRHTSISPRRLSYSAAEMTLASGHIIYKWWGNSEHRRGNVSSANMFLKIPCYKPTDIIKAFCNCWEAQLWLKIY